MEARVRRTPLRYQLAAAVPVLASFTALYVSVIPIDDPTQSTDVYLWLAAACGIPTAFWLLASWLLVQHWWARTGTRLSTMDGPAQLLTAAVATLPASRRGWGEAMLSELAEVPGRSARWRFALSCARAALSLPLPTGWPVLTIAAGVVVAAVTGAYVGVGAALPALRVFAATFVALVGTMVVLALARHRRPRLSASAATILVTAAVAAAAGLTAWLLVQEPTAAEGLPSGRAAFLAVAFAACLWLAVAPPRSLGHGRLAPLVGVGGAIAFVSGLLLVSRPGRVGLPSLWLFLVPEVTFFGCAFVAAASRQSVRAGVRAGIWAAIAITPLGYVAGLLDAFRQQAGDAVSSGLTFAISAFYLGLTLVIGFPFALIGATAGAAYRRTARARTDVPEET